MNPDQTKTRDKEIIVILILALVFMWSGFFLTYHRDPLNLTAQLEKGEKQEELDSQKLLAEAQKKFFQNLKLEATAYLAYNPQTGEIIANQNEKKVLPLASLTKVMTVLAVSDQLKPQARITTTEDGPELTGGLHKDEQWQMASLIALTLVSSSNEGATALAQAATSTEDLVRLMNEKAENLNLGPLYFTNPTGLDDDPAPGGQGSALAVAKLFSYVLENKPELLTATREAVITERSLDGLPHTVLNTNTIVNQIPGLIASKTGYTERAGGNLAVVANIGLQRPIVFVVLGSSKDGRFLDMQKLTQATINYYAFINK